MEIPRSIKTAKGLFNFLMSQSLRRELKDQVTFSLSHRVTRLIASYTVTKESIGILEAVLGAIRDGKAEIVEVSGEESYPIPQYRFY